ncbi:MAG: hypothetical protein ICV63_09355 [Coleofasciculus sp. Co-bin14]|nr:hypothetical protein [Coleofasciculus sp. Co-bin14]
MDSPANVSCTITPILAKVSAGMPHKRLKISSLVGKKLSGHGFLTAEVGIILGSKKTLQELHTQLN